MDATTSLDNKPHKRTTVESNAKIKGVLGFMVTPSSPDESIDLARLCSLADELINAGVNCLTLFGSSGQVAAHSEAERMAAAEALVGHVAHRLPVMVGTGAISTSETVRLTRHAETIGADSVLVVPVTYWKPNEDELFHHYETVADATSLPLCLYNSPRVAGVDMGPAFVERLARLPNLGHMKESSPDLTRISEVKNRLGDRIYLFGGRDPDAFASLQAGADGLALGSTNVLGREMVALYRLYTSGEIDNARALSRKLHPLLEFLLEQGLVRTCHSALKLLGRPVGAPRAPIAMLGSENMEKLAALLRTTVQGA